MTNPLARVVMNNVSKKTGNTEGTKRDRNHNDASYVKISSLTNRIKRGTERDRTHRDPSRNRIHSDDSYMKISNLTNKDKEIIARLINRESEVRDGNKLARRLTLDEAADRVRKRK